MDLRRRRVKSGEEIYERSLIIELLRLRDGMRAHFKPHLRACDISDQYWRVLKTVAEQQPAEVTAISRKAVLPPASLSRILQKMEQAGFLGRSSDPGDLRRTLIALRPRGRKIYNKLAPLIEETYRQLADQIGRDLLGELETVVHRINRKLEQIELAEADKVDPKRVRDRDAAAPDRYD